ncbi:MULTISPECIES: YybH family protein [Bradyrhizobium]
MLATSKPQLPVTRTVDVLCQLRGALLAALPNCVKYTAKPLLQDRFRKVLEAGNDLALVIGEWTSKAQMPTGDTKIWSGTYTDIVRKQSDGTWKLVLDNSHGVEPSKEQST